MLYDLPNVQYTYHCFDVYEQKENAQFYAILAGGQELKLEFSNFPWIRKT